MRSLYLYLLFLFLSGIVSSQALAEAPMQAKIQGFLVTAEKMERDTVQQTVKLTGQVQMTYEDQHIKADSITIYMRQRQIECDGNFEI
ncbi:MAG TPA: LptA/OstA family protein, partial [Pseudobdellovibrionaceae bacterium]|nr:LptA/OstA family protein [Pseudobdellovibrionaceae bacterium]